MNFLSYLLNLSDNKDETTMAAWQELASSHHLRFIPASPLFGRPQVVGDYRGHYLKLYASPKTHTNNDFRHTYVELSINTPQPDNRLSRSKRGPGDRLAVKDVTRLLIPNGLTYRMRGWLSVKSKGQKVCYKQQMLESGIQYLRFIFNLLSNLANSYPKVIALGGEAVPALRTMTRDSNNVLQAVASQLLADIADETATRLGHQVASLLCPRCLVHPDAHRIDVSWWRTITYYGCRICGQSREFSAKQAVAVLDTGMTTEQSEQDEDLRVNWFARRRLFDFAEVEIVQATDEEVEHFAVQIGNDTDSVRKPGYQQMGCTVSPACQLSENTLRMLARIFGRVDVKGIGNL